MLHVAAQQVGSVLTKGSNSCRSCTQGEIFQVEEGKVFGLSDTGLSEHSLCSEPIIYRAPMATAAQVGGWPGR